MKNDPLLWMPSDLLAIAMWKQDIHRLYLYPTEVVLKYLWKNEF